MKSSSDISDPEGDRDALECLRHLAEACIEEGGPTVGDLIDRAFSAEKAALLVLEDAGILVQVENDLVYVSDQSQTIQQMFDGSKWSGPHRYGRVLRRLSGAKAPKMKRIVGKKVRCTRVTGNNLDIVKSTS